MMKFSATYIAPLLHYMLVFLDYQVMAGMKCCELLLPYKL